jgi:hypothetical protein
MQVINFRVDETSRDMLRIGNNTSLRTNITAPDLLNPSDMQFFSQSFLVIECVLPAHSNDFTQSI